MDNIFWRFAAGRSVAEDPLTQGGIYTLGKRVVHSIRFSSPINSVWIYD